VNPGERITLIKKIAAAIAEMDLADAQLTLRQFGLTPEFYVNEYDELDMFQCAIASIQDAGDDVLLSLHEHFFGEAAPSPAHRAEAVAHGMWERGLFRLFISHTSANKGDVHQLKVALRAREIDAFVAHDDIEPTQEWQDVIESALATCEALLAWLTPDFHASNWCDQEVGYCVGRSILILAGRLGQDPYGFIGKYQGFVAGGRIFDDLADEIRDTLVSNDLTASRMAAALVHRFATSGSYAEAKTNFQALAYVPGTALTTELLDQIERATADNRQITDAYYGTGMLRDHVTRFIAERR
jgi:hypothetical protein